MIVKHTNTLNYVIDASKFPITWTCSNSREVTNQGNNTKSSDVYFPLHMTIASREALWGWREELSFYLSLLSFFLSDLNFYEVSTSTKNHSLMFRNQGEFCFNEMNKPQ